MPKRWNLALWYAGSVEHIFFVLTKFKIVASALRVYFHTCRILDRAKCSSVSGLTKWRFRPRHHSTPNVSSAAHGFG